MSALAALLGALAGAAAVWASTRRRERRREALFAFAAHELASPLTAIRLALRSLQDGTWGELAEGQRRFLEKVEDHSAWAGQLAAELGDLARLELGGRLPMRLRNVEPAPLLERAAARARRAGARWGIELDAELGAAPALRTDEDRLERLLDGLLAHALRHSKQPGRVRLKSAGGPAGWSVELDFEPLQEGEDPAALLDRYRMASGERTQKLNGLCLVFARELAGLLGGSLEAGRGSDGRHLFRLSLRA